MVYFVIHSGNDYDKFVQPLLNDWAAKYPQTKFTALTGKQQEWLISAEEKIKQADKVIFIVGEKSHESQNIDKELEISLQEKKSIYIYKLDGKYKVNNCLEKACDSVVVIDGDIEGEKIIHVNDRIINVTKDTILSQFDKDINSIINDLRAEKFDDDAIKMEQYKFFVQTSEELVKRKQTVNSFYITTNSLILGAIISIVCAIKDLPTINGVSSSFIISLFTSFIGIIVCASWLSLIDSYANLNSSKMALISALETNLALNLYDTEWKIMKQKLGKRKYRSFSEKEKYVAFVFLALYVIITVLSFIFIICSL